MKKKRLTLLENGFKLSNIAVKPSKDKDSWSFNLKFRQMSRKTFILTLSILLLTNTPKT